MVKIKNKMYQPLPLVLNGQTIIIPERKSIDVDEVTPQLIALKAKGLIQIIKK